MVVHLTRPGRRFCGWAGAAAVTVLVACLAAGLWVRGASPKERWRGIEEAIRGQNWSEAETRLAGWVRAEPGDGPAWLRLGAVRGVLGRDDAALAAFRNVTRENPAWAVAQESIGEIALRQFRAGEAERALRAAAGRDPKATEPRRRLAYLLTLEQRPDEARAVLWELYRLKPDVRHLITLTGLAGVETDGRDLNPELDQFLARDPADPWLRRARGLTRLLQGKPAEALADLEAAANAFEADPAGRLALVECRLALGQLPRGANAIETFLGPEPGPERPADRARWWVLRSRTEEAIGRPDEALESLNKAVAANPDDQKARYLLGRALTLRGEPGKARPHLERAEAVRAVAAALKLALTDQISGNRSAEAFERIGRLCQSAGLTADARAWYREAIDLEPSRPTSQRALARLATTPDPPPPAVARLRRAVAGLPAPVRAVPADMPDRARFEDIAKKAGLTFQYDPGSTEDMFIADTMGGGVGLIDYDGDGWLDVYFVNGCKLPVDDKSPPAPNRLFRNRRDGTFEDVTARAGVGGRGYGMGCAVGDYDNDGHDDLYVTGLGRAILYRNRGDGTFEDVTARAGAGSTRWTTAAGFGDLDGDGDLDLVVVTYVDADPKTAPVCRDHDGRRMHCLPAYFPDQPDHLFRNNGDGTFTDVTRESGFDAPHGPGLGLAIADLDGDDRLDLFVGNDMAPCFLFRNLGGLRFEEVGVSAGVAYDGFGNTTASMGVVADDLDGDGLIDLFHTNFLEEPDTLLKNLGGGQFRDATAAAGLDDPSRGVTGWGTAAFDADNDGLIDLFVANGHLDQQPALNRPMAQPQHLFLGRSVGRFALATAAVSPYFARRVVSRGAAAGDLDNDGRVDLVVVHRDAPASLLHNTTDGGHWLGVGLTGGPKSGRTPVGARLTCRAGGRTAVRWLTTGTSYLSANDQRFWFGLGDAETIDRLEIRWPSGAVQSWTDVPADRLLRITEGGEPGAVQ